MFIWVGCQLQRGFENRLRQICRRENADLGLDETPFHLPQHISLKISFDAGENWQTVLSWLKDWCQQQRKFYVNLKSPELVPGVLWIPVSENEILQKLHRDLDTQLESLFGIPQHPFDVDFKFHSTLFQDTQEKLSAMYRRLEHLQFADAIPVDTFLLGLSPDNSRGSHRIVAEIQTYR